MLCNVIQLCNGDMGCHRLRPSYFCITLYGENVFSKREHFRFLSGDPSSASFIVYLAEGGSY